MPKQAGAEDAINTAASCVRTEHRNAPRFVFYATKIDYRAFISRGAFFACNPHDGNFARPPKTERCRELRMNHRHGKPRIEFERHIRAAERERNHDTIACGVDRYGDERRCSHQSNATQEKDEHCDSCPFNAAVEKV